jgi:hypothetical protein
MSSDRASGSACAVAAEPRASAVAIATAPNLLAAERMRLSLASVGSSASLRTPGLLALTIG